MLPLRFRPYGELRASGHIARRVDQMSPMIPATHTTRPVTGFVQPDRLSLMRFDADRSACRYFSHSLHVARAKAPQYKIAAPDGFDDSQIENLAIIGGVETNCDRRFVIFEGHDLIGLLAHRGKILGRSHRNSQQAWYILAPALSVMTCMEGLSAATHPQPSPFQTKAVTSI